MSTDPLVVFAIFAGIFLGLCEIANILKGCNNYDRMYQIDINPTSTGMFLWDHLPCKHAGRCQYWSDAASFGPVQSQYWQLMACLQGISSHSILKNYKIRPFWNMSSYWLLYQHDQADRLQSPHFLKNVKAHTTCNIALIWFKFCLPPGCQYY